MKLGCLACFATLSFFQLSPAAAASLRDVDQYLNAPKWEFICPIERTMNLDTIECVNATNCVSEQLRIVVKPADPQNVNIETYSETQLLQTEKLTRARYESMGGNWIRMEFDRLLDMGFAFTISRTQQEQAFVKINGLETTISSLRVEGFARNDSGKLIQGTYIVSRDIVGVGSLIYLFEKQAGLGGFTREKIVTEVQQ